MMLLPLRLAHSTSPVHDLLIWTTCGVFLERSRKDCNDYEAIGLLVGWNGEMVLHRTLVKWLDGWLPLDWHLDLWQHSPWQCCLVCTCAHAAWAMLVFVREGTEPSSMSPNSAITSPSSVYNLLLVFVLSYCGPWTST
eukprot:379084-Amphidinium_carterae.2